MDDLKCFDCEQEKEDTGYSARYKNDLCNECWIKRAEDEVLCRLTNLLTKPISNTPY